MGCSKWDLPCVDDLKQHHPRWKRESTLVAAHVGSFMIGYVAGIAGPLPIIHFMVVAIGFVDGGERPCDTHNLYSGVASLRDDNNLSLAFRWDHCTPAGLVMERTR